MDMFSLAGRTAVITGGTQGIGAEMAIALAEAGSDIILIQVLDITLYFAWNERLMLGRETQQHNHQIKNRITRPKSNNLHRRSSLRQGGR
jgi:short-subunit dehydrogenase involved in D-alanine esterification of teichoic acids